jgi:hypothetical protein
LDHLGDITLGLTVSPDGQTIVYQRKVSGDSDLMLIENFR